MATCSRITGAITFVLDILIALKMIGAPSCTRTQNRRFVAELSANALIAVLVEFLSTTVQLVALDLASQHY